MVSRRENLPERRHSRLDQPLTSAKPNFQNGHLGEISVPTLVISGDLDFPHIQERSRHVAKTVLNASCRELTGVAHLPSLDRPADITGLLAEFISCCSGRQV